METINDRSESIFPDPLRFNGDDGQDAVVEDSEASDVSDDDDENTSSENDSTRVHPPTSDQIILLNSNSCQEEQDARLSLFRKILRQLKLFASQRQNFAFIGLTVVQQVLTQPMDTLVTLTQIGWHSEPSSIPITENTFPIFWFPNMIYYTKDFIRTYSYSALFTGFSTRLTERFIKKILRQRFGYAKSRSERFLSKITILLCFYPFRVLSVQAITKLLNGNSSGLMIKELFKQISFETLFVKLYPGIFAALLAETLTFINTEITYHLRSITKISDDKSLINIEKSNKLMRKAKYKLFENVIVSPLWTVSACAIKTGTFSFQQKWPPHEYSLQTFKFLWYNGQLWRGSSLFCAKGV